MSVIFQSADDTYRALRSQYVRELRQIRKSGAMPDRDYKGWSEDGQLDAAKYPKIKQLWDEMEKTYPQTRAGLAEAKATNSDNLIVAPIIETHATSSALDDLLLTALPARRGVAPVSQLATAFNCDAPTFLVSFRRVRARLVGCKAYECAADGQLCIEVISDET